MRISGFTFVKDAETYDFPIIESLRSMLPVCDELIINVGISSDNTLELIRSINDSKIKIIRTEWDKEFKVRSRILAQQTNIALYKCTGDWCIYLQADEVLHEKDYDNIRGIMQENLDDERVEGILFDYVHFFGSYKTYVNSFHWYRKEIRIIRNHMGIQSWRDAQGFRVDGKKLNVLQCDAKIYHYGWVRDPNKMGRKKKYHSELHHGKDCGDNPEKRFFYEEHIDPYLIAEYRETHPQVMENRIRDWNYDFKPECFKYDVSKKDIRHRITEFINRITGIKIGEYKNYKLVKK